MTHLRERYLTPIIREKLKFNPVVAIQGPRQCGKSFLVKKIIADRIATSEYRTFDQATERNFAKSNPDSYLAQFEDNKPLIIDEAQKVPDIFDAIKFSIDEKKIPGKFIILGSTEFSKLTLVRESLTGRMTKVRLYPFTLSESVHKPFERKNQNNSLVLSPKTNRGETLRYIERGGFPGIFTVNNKNQREALLNDWLELTVDRDIHTFPKVKLDSEIALKILEGVARLEVPDLSSIAKYCKKDTRVVQKHLTALKTLFVITSLEPTSFSSGKTIYFLCDVALVKLLGGDFDRSLRTFVLTELLAKNTYSEKKRKYFYYKNSKGSMVDIVEYEQNKISAIKVIDTEKFDLRDFAVLFALRKKLPKIEIKALAPTSLNLKKEKLVVFPWESVS